MGWRRLGEKKGRALSDKERWILERAQETAELFKRHGVVVAYILAGRRLGASEAEQILHDESKISNRLFELIMEAEREALRERFW